MKGRALLSVAVTCALMLGVSLTHLDVGAAQVEAPVARAEPTAATAAVGGLRTNPTLRARAAMITSTLENSDTRLQYAYVENIGDGRGFTAGRAGFTSGTGDLLLVVERYAQLRPSTTLVRFRPALRRVEGTGSTKGLSGLPAAWRAAAKDARFRGVQDEIANALYLEPAMRLADRYRVRSPLGQAILWDTAIQHGISGQNGLATILRQTYRTKGLATSGEKAWLRTFLSLRLKHLLSWSEGDFDQSPSASRERIATWRSLLKKQRGIQLGVPLAWQAYGDTCSIDKRGRGSGPCR